jgi:hypothetical protein
MIVQFIVPGRRPAFFDEAGCQLERNTFRYRYNARCLAHWCIKHPGFFAFSEKLLHRANFATETAFKETKHHGLMRVHTNHLPVLRNGQWTVDGGGNVYRDVFRRTWL